MKKKDPAENITHENIRGFVKAGVKLFKRDLADEITSFSVGLSYKDFRVAVAAKGIPEEVAIGVFQSIENRILSVTFC